MERYLADECLGYMIVSRLREAGRDVAWVREGGSGLRDEDVLAWAAREERILLTEDYDFGELIFGHGRSAYGVVVLQLSSFAGEWSEAARQVSDCLLAAESGFRGHLTTLGSKRTKSRALPAAS